MRWELVLGAAIVGCGGGVAAHEAKTTPDGSAAASDGAPSGYVLAGGLDGAASVDGAATMDSGGCEPALESCDQGSPMMNQVDLVHDCILSPVQLTPVCLTSVNRCEHSAGIQSGCAFAPDGGVFVGGPADSDNNILTAPGWRFTQYGTFPLNEAATPDEDNECFAASCFPMCPGTPKAYIFCAGPLPDAGGPYDAASDGD